MSCGCNRRCRMERHFTQVRSCMLLLFLHRECCESFGAASVSGIKYWDKEPGTVRWHCLFCLRYRGLLAVISGLLLGCFFVCLLVLALVRKVKKGCLDWVWKPVCVWKLALLTLYLEVIVHRGRFAVIVLLWYSLELIIIS